MTPLVAVPMDLDLRVQPSDDGSGVILYCKGQIVGETSHAFRSAVAKLLTRHPRVLVDLSRIHSLDRRGLETLVSLYSSARTARSTLKYQNLTVPVTDSRSARHKFHKLAS